MQKYLCECDLTTDITMEHLKLVTQKNNTNNTRFTVTQNLSKRLEKISDSAHFLEPDLSHSTH
jgi:hypothetical protein